MLTIKQDTTLVGVSELRKGIDKILKQAEKGLVVIEKRHKPAAVLMSNKEYNDIKSSLETAEDLVLGFIARERHKNSKQKDFIDIEKLLKRLR